MLYNYVTLQEFKDFRDLSRYFKDDDKIIIGLNTALEDLSDDMRAKGYDPMLCMIPLMFDSLDMFETITKAATFTSESLDAGNETRLVVNVSTETASAVVFTLEGSMDETIWIPIKDLAQVNVSISTQANGIYSVKFASRYKHYRYTVTTSESVTYSAYLVDTSFDNLIKWKAIYILMFPWIDADSTAREIYNEAVQSYSTLFNSDVFDYDKSEDGSITASEQDYKKIVTLYR